MSTSMQHQQHIINQGILGTYIRKTTSTSEKEDLVNEHMYKNCMHPRFQRYVNSTPRIQETHLQIFLGNKVLNIGQY